eukprot:TRINITY_DN8440_c0_g1_i1.p1 TRINITY_DN8440_c0_g1~~TRINITY_DN8440_c0_g1_i1.p1  ORF type:complete len:686 (-),score=157.34 TRINITY_DN8440_c0_g1_i1:19-2076(-)
MELEDRDPDSNDEDVADDNGNKTHKKSSKDIVYKASSEKLIRWIHENYEISESGSIPRGTLYTHYVTFCTESNIEPLNSSTFGKMVHSLFPNLKTRRLGTRGNSRYHYFGIRMRTSSDMKLSPSLVNQMYGGQGAPLSPENSSLDMEQMNKRQRKDSGAKSSESPPAAIPEIPELIIPPNFIIPQDIPAENLVSLLQSYRQHSQNLLETLARHQMSDVEKILRIYWQSIPLSWRPILRKPEVIDLLIEKDFLVYKTFNMTLLPNVLQALPVVISHSLRTFAKNFENWLAAALEGFPSLFVEKKLAVAGRFSFSLHKQASLNHLTQTARAILQNDQQVTQMLLDWGKTDFHLIIDQSAAICDVPIPILMSAQDEFRKNLSQRIPLEQWALWIQDLAAKALGRITDPKALIFGVQQLVLKWSYFSSLYIRDLTIRNATSFGSFHLLRTLFDDYLQYLLEIRYNEMLTQILLMQAQVNQTAPNGQSQHHQPQPLPQIPQMPQPQPQTPHTPVQNNSASSQPQASTTPSSASTPAFPFGENYRPPEDESTFALDGEFNFQYPGPRFSFSMIPGHKNSLDDFRMSQMISSSGLDRLQMGAGQANNSYLPLPVPSPGKRNSFFFDFQSRPSFEAFGPPVTIRDEASGASIPIPSSTSLAMSRKRPSNPNNGQQAPPTFSDKAKAAVLSDQL